MTATATFALIGVTVVALLLFTVAAVHYVTQLTSEMASHGDDGHGGAGH